MSELYPRIRLHQGDDGERHLFIRESVSITFYMRRSHHEIAKAVMHSLDVYRRAVGPQVLGWFVDDEGEWRKLDDNIWESTRRRVLEEPTIRLWLSERADATADHDFLYQGRLLDAYGPGATSAVAFFLPTEYLEAHGPGRIRELALELAAELPFNSGHAGLSFHFPEDLLNTHRLIRDECFRHPGLDIPSLGAISSSLGTRVKGVHWLTFLGQPVLGELGGVGGLRARLHSPGTSVQQLDGERAVVTLDQWPQAGDMARGNNLPAYRELARVLEPWLQERHQAWNGLTKEEVRRWERRFLD